jgi:hypothetical protein
VCPRVAVVPVEIAGDGEIGVGRGGVGAVTDESVYPGAVGGEPGRVEIADYGGGVDEVAVAVRLLVGRSRRAV